MAEISDINNIIKEVSPHYAKSKSCPSQELKLMYNSSYETLEPVYFWILDFLNSRGEPAEKLMDNFSSSPGSGHFSELMGKGTKMQEEAMKAMQTIGVLIKSIINIIYDLRQFESRLNDYDLANSKDQQKREDGLISLKQVWMDNVDIKRGNTSIKMMTFSQASFATLIDAFMTSKSKADVEKLDLNERVKRIVSSRFEEFEKWKELSEKELRKRYSIEKSYLKSQVDSLKLYSRWARPYLKAAEELKMSETPNAALVKAFNTIVIQLAIIKKDKLDIASSVLDKQLPKGFDRVKFPREYYSCILVEFTFRGIPSRMEQHYTFGGRVDVSFKAYALNKEELDLLKYKMEQSDLKQALNFVEGATTESLSAIEEDIKYFLKSKEEQEKEEEKKKKSNDVNPFTALLGLDKILEKKKQKNDKKSQEEAEKERIENLDEKGIKRDNYYEKVLRALAESNAKTLSFKVYDIYKKAHGMASPPRGKDFPAEDVKVGFAGVFKG